MSDEPTVKIPTAWVGPIVKAAILALLGSNLWQSATVNKELTRDAARWDTSEWADQRAVNKEILAALKRIEGRP